MANRPDDYELLKEKVSAILDNQNGRDVLWHILGMCELHTDGFTGDTRESYISGKRSIGLQILQLLEDVDPTIYPKLILNNIEVQ